MVNMTICVNGTVFVGGFNTMDEAIQALINFEGEKARAVFGQRIRNKTLEKVVKKAKKEQTMISMKWRLEETA